MHGGNEEGRPIEILLVQGEPTDVRLTQDGLVDGKVANLLTVVPDAVEALNYFRRELPYSEVQRPDVILLDLPPKSRCRCGWMIRMTQHDAVMAYSRSITEPKPVGPHQRHQVPIG